MLLSPQLTFNVLQGFLQRRQNYLSKAVVEQVVMRLARNNQQQFMQESGLRMRAYDQGFSTSAAAIIAADWAAIIALSIHIPCRQKCM